MVGLDMYHFFQVQSPNGVFSDEHRSSATPEYTLGVSTSERWIYKDILHRTCGKGRGIVSVRSHLEESELACAPGSVKSQPINQATLLKHP